MGLRLQRATLYTMEPKCTGLQLAHVELCGLALWPFESLYHRSCLSYKVCCVSGPCVNSNGEDGYNWGR